MEYLYSAKNNIFYPADDLPAYETAGSLPTDLVEVSDDIFQEFGPFINGDHIRIAGPDGFPAWGDRPALTTEAAAIKKNAEMSSANAAIVPLQDAVDLDIATDEEKTALTNWKKYRVLLMRIDTSKAPGIEWPTPPVSPAS
ncbi:tail fiber assembly protein [Klebsiella sp. Ap-873]|nr:tail fiber assembly protein [Klebsiella sp. Ap-873]